jgi:hypothetical protein
VYVSKGSIIHTLFIVFEEVINRGAKVRVKREEEGSGRQWERGTEGFKA